MNNSRTRHSDDYHQRKEKSASNDRKSSTYRRNSQQYSAGLHDEQTHNYNNRRGDDWHDPWDRFVRLFIHSVRNCRFFLERKIIAVRQAVEKIDLILRLQSHLPGKNRRSKSIYFKFRIHFSSSRSHSSSSSSTSSSSRSR